MRLELKSWAVCSAEVVDFEPGTHSARITFRHGDPGKFTRSRYPHFVRPAAQQHHPPRDKHSQLVQKGIALRQDKSLAQRRVVRTWDALLDQLLDAILRPLLRGPDWHLERLRETHRFTGLSLLILLTYTHGSHCPAIPD
jgi:hypothetical protein